MQQRSHQGQRGLSAFRLWGCHELPNSAKVSVVGLVAFWALMCLMGGGLVFGALDEFWGIAFIWEPWWVVAIPITLLFTALDVAVVGIHDWLLDRRRSNHN